MNKLCAFIVGGCLAFVLTACSAGQSNPVLTTSPSPPDSISDTTESTLPMTPSATMNAIVLPTVKETVHADDGTLLVSLSFPRAQVILQDELLEEKIIGDFQTRIGPVISTLSQIEEQARLSYADLGFHSGYFIDISYTPTRLDEAVLSLFGNTSIYSGGAHPSLGTDSVTYDLQTGEVLCLDDILTEDTSPDTIYQLVLKNLEVRSEDLYYDYADALGDRFTGSLHSIQDWYFSRNGLCFHFAPYDIAPYSSGTVIAELPYSTLSGILDEQYFPSGSLSDTGSMYAETFIESDSERFTYIADVSLQEDSNGIILYPDATVTDIRIESGILNEENNQYIAVGTVFAANTMNVGEAIHLRGNLETNDNVLRLVYHSCGQTYSAFISYSNTDDSILLTNDLRNQIG